MAAVSKFSNIQKKEVSISAGANVEARRGRASQGCELLSYIILKCSSRSIMIFYLEARASE